MFLSKYMKMCKKAKEIQEEFYSKIQNMLQFEKDIYVYHPKKRKVEKLIRCSENSVTTTEEQYLNLPSEMIWVLTEEQIREKAKQFENMFSDFFSDHKAKCGHPARRFEK